MDDQRASGITVGQQLLNRDSALSFLQIPTQPNLSITTALVQWLSNVINNPQPAAQTPPQAAAPDLNAEQLLQYINLHFRPDLVVNATNLVKTVQEETPMPILRSGDARAARYSFVMSNDDLQLLITVEYCPLVALVLDGGAESRYLFHVHNYEVPSDDVLRRPPPNSTELSQFGSPGRSPSRKRKSNYPTRSRAPASAASDSPPAKPSMTGLISIGNGRSTQAIIKTHSDELKDAAEARKTRALEFRIGMNEDGLVVSLVELIFSKVILRNDNEVQVDPPSERHSDALRRSNISKSQPMSGLAHNRNLIHSLGWKLAHRANTNLPVGLQDKNSRTLGPETLQVDTSLWNRLVGKDYGGQGAASPTNLNGTLLWSVLLKLMLTPPVVDTGLGWMMLNTYGVVDNETIPMLPSVYDLQAIVDTIVERPCVSVFNEHLHRNLIYRRPSLLYLTTTRNQIQTSIRANNHERMAKMKSRGVDVSANVALSFAAKVYNQTKDTAIRISKTQNNLYKTLSETPEYWSATNGISDIQVQLCVDYTMSTTKDAEQVKINRVWFTWQQLSDTTTLDRTVPKQPASVDAPSINRNKRPLSSDDTGCDSKDNGFTRVEYDQGALRTFLDVHEEPRLQQDLFQGGRLFTHSDSRTAICDELIKMLRNLESRQIGDILYSDGLALCKALCKQSTAANKSALNKQIEHFLQKQTGKQSKQTLQEELVGSSVPLVDLVAGVEELSIGGGGVERVDETR